MKNLFLSLAIVGSLAIITTDASAQHYRRGYSPRSTRSSFYISSGYRAPVSYRPRVSYRAPYGYGYGRGYRPTVSISIGSPYRSRGYSYGGYGYGGYGYGGYGYGAYCR